MNINYEKGTVLAFWYDNWLAVAGFGVALLMALLVARQRDGGTRGLVSTVLMVVAVLAALPLALVRLGLDVTLGVDVTTLGNQAAMDYLSLAGVAGSLAVGLSRILAATFGRGRRVAVQKAGTATPEQGVPLPPEGEEATRTLVHEAVAQGPGAADITGEEAGSAPALQAPTAWLLFRSGTNVGQSIPLSTEVTTIGRASENDVVIDDVAVSRQHARIFPEGGRYVLEDTGSSGGTLVEGAPARRTILTSGSTIRVGETELVFMHGEDSPGRGTMGGPGAGAGRPGETVVMEQQAAVLAWLAITAGSDRGKTRQLKAGETTIGRDPGNDVVIADAEVSRRHALIRHQEGGFLLVDLGSTRGTRINGQDVGGKALPDRGVISLGQTQLVAVAVEVPQTAQPVGPEGATMMAQPKAIAGVLVARSGPDAGKSFPLQEGDNAIGRDPECQVVLADTAISRRHALVRPQDGGFVVYDLGSRSGTRVDNETVAGTRLSVGDTISIGRTEMVLMQPQQAKQ